MRILIVEDNRNLATILERMFANHNTTTVSKLEDAVEKVAQQKPDLVILDCMLDDTNHPHQTINDIPRMIESSPDTAILVYTGYGSDEIRAEAIARGACGVIAKKPMRSISELTVEMKQILADSKFASLVQELEDVLEIKL